jgi:hypothetical protein
VSAPDLSPLGAALRTWLMRAPRPAVVRVYTRDGRELDIELVGGASWSESAASVAALEPERLEALGPEGKTIRAVLVADLLKKLEVTTAQNVASVTALQSSDPETQRLIAIAELLSRAHERATAAIENTVGVAFTQMQEICNSLAVQANAAQQSANELSMAIRNLLIQQAQEAIEPEKPHPLEAMATNFLAGAQMGQAEKATAKPTNGKH